MARYDWQAKPYIGPASVTDLDTGKEVNAIWADTDTGEYEEFVVDDQGKVVFDLDTGPKSRVVKTIKGVRVKLSEPAECGR